MNSSPSNTPAIDPDQPCVLCEETRENHGDKNHRFSINGELVTIKAGADPKKEAPKTAAEQVQASDLAKEVTAQMTLRLVDRLVDLGFLTAKDLLYILGGKE